MGRKVDRGNINSKLSIKTLDELIDDELLNKKRKLRKMMILFR